MAEIKKIDWDSPDTLFNEVYTIPKGDVFKYTKNYESLMLRIEADKPTGLTFEVRAVTPGTPTYTLYGDNTVLVVENTP